LSARKSEPPQPPKDLAKGYISLSDSDGDSDTESENESVKGTGTLPVRKPNQPISLDEDDDDVVIAPRVVRPPPPPVEDDANMSEEEFPELVAAAKERQRQQATLKAKAEAAVAGYQDGDDIFDTEATASNLDPIIEILITSRIKGTNPICVKRRLYGKLREAIWAWCDRQVFDGQKMPEEMKAEVFLTRRAGEQRR
jgi:hypothetical protein